MQIATSSIKEFWLVWCTLWSNVQYIFDTQSNQGAEAQLISPGAPYCYDTV